MPHLNPATPLGALVMLLAIHRSRARAAERGASAVEWVVIAAIVVGICILVAGIIRGALQGRAQQLEGEIQGT
jgi:Flp pilus assembly pilin Flp